MVTKEELIAFEKDICETYCEGKIRAPIHLDDGSEDQLIEIFKNIRTQDWIFVAWRSHLLCLLKGVPQDELKKRILEGDSITLCFPQYNILSSAIVGGVLPIAVGTAMGIKKKGDDKKVFAFLGDMTAETGDFHLCHKYALNHDLPIEFVIMDNHSSVGTPTRTVWNIPDNVPLSTMPEKIDSKTWKFYYEKTYQHVGAGRFIVF